MAVAIAAAGDGDDGRPAAAQVRAVEDVVVHQRRRVDQLDGDRGAQEAGAHAVRGRAGGHEHEQRPQALAARGDRRAGVLAEHRPVRGGDLGQARLEPLEHRRGRARPRPR